MEIKQVEGIWLPKDDTHFEKMFLRFPKVGGKATYQYDVLQAGLTYCRRRQVAVDIGAHVGLWARVLCDHFSRVLAFEPVFTDCFRRNLEDKSNVTLYPVALSDRSGSVEMEVNEGNSGSTHVASVPTGRGETVPTATLDSYGLADVDLIKIDVEGWEYRVLRGAGETLLRCRPVVIFEHKGHEKAYQETQGSVEYLRTLGAELFETTKKDVIMGWGVGRESSGSGG
jgi:FkbM family methyltransferase